MSIGKMNKALHNNTAYLLPIIFGLFFIPLCFTSCKEVGPNIDLGNTKKDTSLVDTNYLAASVDTVQQKNVLIEDFTGVKCKNCPTGATTAEGLAAANPGRVVIAAIHSNFLDDPHTEVANPDLRNTQAQDIENLLGPLVGKPSAAIDRGLYSGQAGILIFQVNAWPGAFALALTATTPVNVYVTSRYIDSSRTVIARVTLNYTQAVTNTNRITVMVTEDSIRASQTLPNDSTDNNFIQQHVLRTTLTSDMGDVITATKEPKRTIVKEYKLSPVPADWTPEKLNIVALVHESTTTSFKVLQVAQVRAK